MQEHLELLHIELGKLNAFFFFAVDQFDQLYSFNIIFILNVNYPHIGSRSKFETSLHFHLRKPPERTFLVQTRDCKLSKPGIANDFLQLGIRESVFHILL